MVFLPIFAEVLAILCNIPRVETGIDLISVSDPLRTRLSQSQKIGRDRDKTKVYYIRLDTHTTHKHTHPATNETTMTRLSTAATPEG
jgi:hypothetical protein